MPSSVLILGLGNLLRGDDGVGPRVVEALTRHGLPEVVAALDGGTGGVDLLGMLEGWSRVVVVDAADVGREPGEFVRFTLDQSHIAASSDDLTLHNAGLADALALARALEHPLPPMVIFGVQPERVGWGEGLSPAVEAALPELIEAILEEVGEDNA